MFSDAVFNAVFGVLITPFIWILKLWWLWVFIFLLLLSREFWRHWRVQLYKNAVQWTVLEILMPREVRKSPKAMEQLFNQIHALRNAPGDVKEWYWDGEVPLWFSFEVASFGGEIHFFVRVPKKYRHIVESNIYANYVDVEVVEAEDYVNRMPGELQEVYRMGIDIFGIELNLGRESSYPIRTYPVFESPDEERTLDPFANMVEILSKTKREEQVWLQLVIRPEDPNWKERGYQLVKELKQQSLQRAKLDVEMVFSARSPGETDIMKAIEEKVGKAPFETVIRYLYIAPRAIFDRQLAYRGVRAAFGQYSAHELNFFVGNNKTRTMVNWVRFPFIFPRYRAEARKERIWKDFRQRNLPQESIVGKIFNSHLFYFDTKSQASILNSEELATVYHLPSYLVLTAPFMKRVEARRLGPPAGLEVFGEEAELPGLEPVGGKQEPSTQTAQEADIPKSDGRETDADL